MPPEINGPRQRILNPKLLHMSPIGAAREFFGSIAQLGRMKILHSLRADLSTILSMYSLREISFPQAEGTVLELGRTAAVKAFGVSDIGFYNYNLTRGELENPLREGFHRPPTYLQPKKPIGEKDIVLRKIMGNIPIDETRESIFEGENWRCLYIWDRSPYGNFEEDLKYYPKARNSVLKEILYFFPKEPPRTVEGMFELPIIQVSNWHNNRGIFLRIPRSTPKMLEDMGSFLAEIMEKLDDLRFKNRIMHLESSVARDQHKYRESSNEGNGLHFAGISYPTFETSRYFYNFIPIGGLDVFYFGAVRSYPPASGISALEIDGALEAMVVSMGSNLNIAQLLYNFNLSRKSSSEVPLFFGVFNPKTGMLEYCASQTYPFYFSQAEGTCRKLDITTHNVVGEGRFTTFGTKTISLDPGDCILITKGPERTVNSPPAVFPQGEDRVMASFLQSSAKSPQEILHALLQSTAEYRGDMPQSYDLAALAVKVREEFSKTWDIHVTKLQAVVQREYLNEIVSSVKILDPREEMGKAAVIYIMMVIDEGFETNSPPREILLKIVGALSDVKKRLTVLPPELLKEKLKRFSAFMMGQQLRKDIRADQIVADADRLFGESISRPINDLIADVISSINSRIWESQDITFEVATRLMAGFKKILGDLREKAIKKGNHLAASRAVSKLKEIEETISQSLTESTLYKHIGDLIADARRSGEKIEMDPLSFCASSFDNTTLSIENLMGKMVKDTIAQEILSNMRILGFTEETISEESLKLALSENIDNVMMYGGAGEKAYSKCFIGTAKSNLVNEETGEHIPAAGQDAAIIEIYNEYTESNRDSLPQRGAGEHGRGCGLTCALTSKDSHFVEKDLGNGKKSRKATIIIYKNPSFRKADEDSIRDSFLQGLDLDGLI